MAVEDTQDLLKFDLESSRVVAAMKVTGITLADLELKSPLPADGSGLSPRELERARRRHEVLDRKRRLLVKALEATAETLDDNYVSTIALPGMSESEQACESASVVREQEKLELRRQRMRTKMAVQLGAQFAKKQAVDPTVKEDAPKRSPEQDKEYQEDLKRKKDEKEKAAEQKVLALRRAHEKEREKMIETSKKLRETNKRINAFMDSKMNERTQAMEDRRRHMAEIADRNLRAEKEMEDGIVRNAMGIIQRQQDLEDRVRQLNDEKASRSDQKAAQNSSREEYRLAELEKQKEKREEAYKKSKEKWEKSKADRHDKANEILDKIREKRDKDNARLEQNRQHRRSERREFMKKIRERIKTSDQHSKEVKQKYIDSSVGVQAETQALYRDIVQGNRERISRSDAWGREQTIEKIKAVDARINGLKQEKQALIDIRYQAQREAMLDKSKVDELQQMMLSAPSRKIKQAMQDLDMSVLADPVAKEGEEAEEKK